jgi:energy-converting hydrogenase A subunit M
MTVSRNYLREQDLVSPKQRETLEIKRAEFIDLFEQRLALISVPEIREELMRKRDHCMSKWPITPANLSIWIVAYWEDWMREANRAE